MNLLELNHVEKSFENLSVLKDISISIGEGEIVSIIGPSDPENQRCFAVRRC